jgi:hypothetical protein
MKASVMSRAGDVRVEEVPDPVIEEPTDAIIRAGRYHEVAGSLRVKEVRIAEHERFVICHSPEVAERDAAIRACMTNPVVLASTLWKMRAVRFDAR